MSLNRRTFLGAAAAAPVAAQQVASGLADNTVASSPSFLPPDLPMPSEGPARPWTLMDVLKQKARDYVEQETWSHVSTATAAQALEPELKSVAPWFKRRMAAQISQRAYDKTRFERMKQDFLPGYRAKKEAETLARLIGEATRAGLDPNTEAQGMSS